MMLATTKVEDLDRFLKIFSTKGAEKRKQHGSKGSIVFSDPNENDRVWAIFDWDEAGLQELPLRPRGPGDHPGGRAQGPARGAEARGQVRRLSQTSRRVAPEGRGPPRTPSTRCSLLAATGCGSKPQIKGRKP